MVRNPLLVRLNHFPGPFSKLNPFWEPNILPTMLGLPVSQGTIAPDTRTDGVLENVWIFEGSLGKFNVTCLFVKKIFYYCEKRCPLWSTKKCPNFLVHYSQPTTVWSLHICKWTYFHTFQIPFSFFIYSSISNTSGLSSPIVPVRCMSGDYTTKQYFSIS